RGIARADLDIGCRLPVRGLPLTARNQIDPCQSRVRRKQAGEISSLLSGASRPGRDVFVDRGLASCDLKDRLGGRMVRGGTVVIDQLVRASEVNHRARNLCRVVVAGDIVRRAGNPPSVVRRRVVIEKRSIRGKFGMRNQVETLLQSVPELAAIRNGRVHETAIVLASGAGYVFNGQSIALRG